MWFKKKPKNRKLSKELVLDVRLRNDAARMGHARVAARLMTLLFGGLAAGFIAWWAGSWALNRLLYQNPSLAIEKVEVTNKDGVVPPDQIRRWSGVNVGENLMALDLRRVRHNLQLVPAIESALVRRGFPRTLYIDVVEREPAAQVHVIGRTAQGIEVVRFLIDAGGFAMSPGDFGSGAASMRGSSENLTVILGLEVDQIRPGSVVELPKLRAALALIDLFNRTDLVSVSDLASIDLSPPEVLLVKTSQGATITMAPHQLEDQLKRWRMIQDRAQGFGKSIASLDLSITNNNPAVWIEASLAPMVPRKPAKLTRPRRKNA